MVCQNKPFCSSPIRHGVGKVWLKHALAVVRHLKGTTPRSNKIDAVVVKLEVRLVQIFN